MVMSRSFWLAVVALCVIGTALFYSVMSSQPPLEVRIVSSKASFRKGEIAHFDFYLVCAFCLAPVSTPSLSNEVTISGSGGPVFSRRELIHRKEPVTIGWNSQLKFGELDWNLCDLSGKPVPPGRYRISVSLIDSNLSSEITVEVGNS